MDDNKYTSRRIAALLEQYIIENQIATGVKIDSAAQLARKYAVSAKTADRALNLLARRNLITRIHGRGNFVKAYGETYNNKRVAFFCNVMHNPQDESIFSTGIILVEICCSILKEYGIKYELLFKDDLFSRNSLLSESDFIKYDALLMSSMYRTCISDFACKVPGNLILYGDDKVHIGPWHQVVYDYEPGFLKALQYCLKHHYRKFFIPGFSREVVRHRHQALLSVARKLKIPYSNFQFYYANEYSSAILAGQNCARYFLQNKLNDHVIISSSDLITLGMVDVFKQQNLVNNSDYRIISYDNMQELFTDGKINLDMNSIIHPIHKHAEALCSLLLDLLKKDTCFYRTYFTPATELIIRHPFCGPANKK